MGRYFHCNNGVVLWATNEDSNGYDLRIRSSEYSDSTKWPYLEIEYSIPSLSKSWYIKDHLGSTRAIVYQAQIKEAYDYYPYGLIMPGRSYVAGSDKAQVKFTGKERDTETNLDYFGARYYSAALGRFLTVDRFADKYPSLSPFLYAANDPVKFIDVNGDSIVYHEYIMHGMKFMVKADHTIMQNIIDALNYIQLNLTKKQAQDFFRVNSTYRTQTEQNRLRSNKEFTELARKAIKQLLFGKEPTEKQIRWLAGNRYQPYPVAKVSYHNSGFALDVNYRSIPSKSIRHVIKTGFELNGFTHGIVYNDPPHFQIGHGWSRKRLLIEANKAESTINKNGFIPKYQQRQQRVPPVDDSLPGLPDKF